MAWDTHSWKTALPRDRRRRIIRLWLGRAPLGRERSWLNIQEKSEKTPVSECGNDIPFYLPHVLHYFVLRLERLYAEKMRRRSDPSVV